MLIVALGGAISTHAPRTGSDIYLCHARSPTAYFNPRSPHGERRFIPKRQAESAISTHAPRTGSDITRRNNQWLRKYFNPRSPHGERRDTAC